MGKLRPLVVALVVALCGAAWAQEGEGGAEPKGKGRPFRQGPEGRPPLKEGPPGLRLAMPGMDIPIVREEMQRHAEAIRELMAGHRDLAQQVAAEAKALREKNTPQAEIEKALADKFGPQAEGAAAKLADEFARHYEALLKIYKENRDATVKAITQNILTRMANREVRPPAGGPPGWGKGERPFPKAKEAPPKAKDNMPENF